MSEHLTAADLNQLAALSRAAGIPEHIEATPAQTLEVLRRAPQELAERLVTHWRDRSREAMRCWEFAHESQIEHFHARIRAGYPGEPTWPDDLFVAELRSGTYGPFPSREHADTWAAAWLRGESSWSVVPLRPPVDEEEEPRG